MRLIEWEKLESLKSPSEVIPRTMRYIKPLVLTQPILRIIKKNKYLAPYKFILKA